MIQDNIFLDGRGGIKIADIGLCVYSEGFSRNYFSMRTSNARWAAPEIMDSRQQPRDIAGVVPQGMIPVGRPTKRSDVHSFACFCIEVCLLRISLRSTTHLP